MRRLGHGIRAALLASIAAAAPLNWFARGRHGLAVFCLVALATSALVPGVLRRTGLRMPLRLQLVWLLPFAACWGFGEGFALFERVAWWDRLTHALGGAAVYALYVHFASGRLRRSATVATGVLVALAVGALWEIGEFASDSLFATATQHGNTDTMGDLIFDLVGGLSGASLGALAARAAAWRHRQRSVRADEVRVPPT